MKTKSLAAWPAILPENSLTVYTTGKSPKQRPGVVKAMPPVPQPDEQTIRQLNDLAAQRPFCTFRKVRQHDTL